MNNILRIINEEIENVDLLKRVKCLEKTMRAELEAYTSREDWDDRWVDIRSLHRKVESYLKYGAFHVTRDFNDSWMENFLQGLDFKGEYRYKRGEDVTNQFPELKSKGVNVYKAVGEGVLFRGVSLDDWNRIQAQGYINSDMRGAIFDSEGINLAQNPSTAQYYLPHNSQGVILAINPEGLDLYELKDEYIRVFEPIPIDKVIKVSDVVTKDDMGGMLAVGDVNRQILNDIENQLKELNVPINCN